MTTVKEKYGFLPTSVWHLSKSNELNDWFKDKSDVRTSKRTDGSFLPNYKLSEYNPNVAERIVKYWSNEEDIIFDPFAGRATRGIISAKLNRKYVGCEVSKSTFDWTNETLYKLSQKLGYEYFQDNIYLINADGCIYHEELPSDNFDLVFTCPPYWKLEKYETCAGQLSDCKTYKEFMVKITECIQQCNRVLKQDKFSIWTVADWRNNGYYNFHSDVISAHLANGFVLWDIVINVLNSPFVSFKAAFNDKYKYTGKSHEYILVFKKVSNIGIV